jgi:hypothetical protein
MSAQATTSLGSDILDPERAYEFRDREVPHYLRSNPELVPLLGEIASVIPRYFGPDTPLALAVLHDPEGGPEPELHAVIVTPLASDRALARMREFDQDWWFPRVPRVAERLTVTLD